MAREIERRFLLRGLPSHDSGGEDTEYYIHQYYLKNDDNVVERVRHQIIDDPKTEVFELEGHNYFHTVKKDFNGISCEEIEREITLDEFNKLKERTFKIIYKKRLIYNRDGLKWEIDDFSYNGDDTLVIAEVELPSEDYDLTIPEWLQKLIVIEITGMNEFSNYNLASEPAKIRM